MRHHLPAAIWAVLVAVLLLLPGETLGVLAPPLPLVDKIAHAGLFFVLVILVDRSFRRLARGGRAFALALATLVSLGYGVMLELVQLWSTHRSGELADGVADSVGVVTAALLLAWRAPRPARPRGLSR